MSFCFSDDVLYATKELTEAHNFQRASKQIMLEWVGQHFLLKNSYVHKHWLGLANHATTLNFRVPYLNLQT